MLNLQKNSPYWDVKWIEKAHNSSKEELREKEMPYTSMDTVNFLLIRVILKKFYEIRIIITNKAYALKDIYIYFY